MSFSRPGYGLTDVGRLNAEEFVPAVAKSCELLAIEETAGCRGVLWRHASHPGCCCLPGSGAAVVPSQLRTLHRAHPDTRLEALLGTDRLRSGHAAPHLGDASARLVDSDAGLRRMVRALSKRPIDDWWYTWSHEDRAPARELFKAMRSGAGFVNDLQQGLSDRGAYRRRFQAEVRCPTLVSASRDDAGVAFGHAEDFADTIPNATLVELDAPQPPVLDRAGAGSGPRSPQRLHHRHHLNRCLAEHPSIAATVPTSS